MSLQTVLLTVLLAVPVLIRQPPAQRAPEKVVVPADADKSVAITVDDLPFVFFDTTKVGRLAVGREALAANRKLVDTFARHHVPVTGFVIEKSVSAIGRHTGTEILKSWIKARLDLGNHSYSHPDFNELSIEEVEAEIVGGETTFLPLMTAAARSSRFFRFPANHTGDTRAKHDAVAAFLVQRGYRCAGDTIETSDWMFNESYHRMLVAHDEASAARLKTEYLAFTAAQIDYFERLNEQVLGYAPPQVMLLHDNQLNADLIDQILALFEQRHYRFVTLTAAQADPAYQIPETHVTKYGPMWGYRWSWERGVKVNGASEPQPPEWVGNYGK